MMKTIYQNTLKAVQKFIRGEEGVTAIEYGLIAAATAVAIIVALNGLGPKLSAIFQSISTNV